MGGFITSGEGGIRTHAPLRTNGFQDRLVMTTSIPLRVSDLFLSVSDIDYINTNSHHCQQLFLIFLKKFLKPINPLVLSPLCYSNLP